MHFFHSELRGRTLRVVSMCALLFGGTLVGCGAAQTEGTTALTAAELQQQEDDRIAEARARRVERARIRELEGQLALEQARRHAPPSETVRIGADREREDARWESDQDWQTPQQVEQEDVTPPARESRGRRPVLRLYGTPRPEPVNNPFSMGAPPGVPGFAPLPSMGTPPPPIPVTRTPGADPMTAFAATAPTPRVRTQPPVDRAVTTYRAALALVRDRQFDQALTAFTSFGARYPEHPYAGNARYWRGEVHYIRRNYARAIVDFQHVVDDHSSSSKVADALLKIGMCHVRQGNLARANEYFRRLRSEHPNSVAARTAPREDAS